MFTNFPLKHLNIKCISTKLFEIKYIFKFKFKFLTMVNGNI